MHITLYRGARAPEPIAQDDFERWGELADSIADLVSRESGAPAGADPEEQKRQMFAWAPHRLRVPYRLLANVAEVTLLVLDIDHCPDVAPIADALTALGGPALVYESPSSTPEALRVRVVARCDRPMTVAECGPARRAFAELLGIGPKQGIEGAIDAQKLFFAGRLHGTPARQVWRFGE